jgi:hypothetical protein
VRIKAFVRSPKSFYVASLQLDLGTCMIDEKSRPEKILLMNTSKVRRVFEIVQDTFRYSLSVNLLFTFVDSIVCIRNTLTTFLSMSVTQFLSVCVAVGLTPLSWEDFCVPVLMFQLQRTEVSYSPDVELEIEKVLCMIIGILGVFSLIFSEFVDQLERRLRIAIRKQQQEKVHEVRFRY